MTQYLAVDRDSNTVIGLYEFDTRQGSELAAKAAFLDRGQAAVDEDGTVDVYTIRGQHGYVGRTKFIVTAEVSSEDHADIEDDPSSDDE